VERILPLTGRIYEERLRRLEPDLLASIVMDAEAAKQSPKQGRRRLKVYKATQTAINPPTFSFTVNDAKLVHFSYQRFLENKMRHYCGFKGTPLRLLFKGKGEKSQGMWSDSRHRSAITGFGGWYLAMLALNIAVALIGYLMGSIPFGILVSKVARGIDVRMFGSGKTGTANVIRTAGGRAGAVTMMLDLSKASAAVLISWAIVPSHTAQVVAALAAIMGHIWSVYIKFHGGRGVALRWRPLP
jgi:hypothetical protein